MTAEELLRYSRDPYRHELVAGMLVEMEPPGIEHTVVASRFAGLLLQHVDAHRLGLVLTGEAGFHLASDPDTVLGPDSAFIAQARIDEVGIPRGYWPGPPDLAVEVVSPNDRRSEVERKARLWVQHGTGAVLILDPPPRTATVYRLGGETAVEDTLDLSDVVADFTVPVAQLFA